MSTKNPDPYGKFLASYLQELIETPDADILSSEKDVVEPDFGAKLLAKAKAEAARRRLSRAKAGVSTTRRDVPNEASADFTPAVARVLLAKYANDSRLTLAARNLDELSDEDVIRLCEQLQHLEHGDNDPEKDGV